MLDLTIIAVYILLILSVGWLGLIRAKTREDYLVAGRRLGPLFYTSTMAATVLGGASTIGSIGLGYRFGLSGLWLAACLGLGLIGLSLFLAEPLIRLKLFTVTQLLEMRYRPVVRLAGSATMLVYDLMVAVTSTIAMGAILQTLLHIPFSYAILLSGSVVVIYSVLGGMWSLTMTDVIQFGIMTGGLLFIMLPLSIDHAGGWQQMHAVLPARYFDLTGIGWPTIITYFLIYFLGMFIGQDIWQRVFTARNPRIARWGGVSAGVYCIIYGTGGALIGMAGRVFLPELPNPDQTFAAIVQQALPVGVRGLVVAAALSALMSTASACLLAASTIGVYDLYAHVVGKEKCHIRTDRIAALIAGIAMIIIASLVSDVIAALTLAYNLLVGMLLVPLIGAISWRRASSNGAIAAIIAGGVTVIALILKDGLLANSPIYYGLAASLLAFVGGSLWFPDKSWDGHWETQNGTVK